MRVRFTWWFAVCGYVGGSFFLYQSAPATLLLATRQYAQFVRNLRKAEFKQKADDVAWHPSLPKWLLWENSFGTIEQRGPDVFTADGPMFYLRMLMPEDLELVRSRCW